MDATEEETFEIHARDLRAELKRWETTWAASHGGRKPDREDIKEDRQVAQKYKQYNKLRKSLAEADREGGDSKKRKQFTPSLTPSKRPKHAQTPSKVNKLTEKPSHLATPSVSRQLFSPTVVTSIGPTPQKNGKVLGLFDLLVQEELGTPSKSGPTRNAENEAAPQASPCNSGEKLAHMRLLCRTPTLSRKRQHSGASATPDMKPSSLEEFRNTPSSSSALLLNTPSFLKRSRLPALDQHGDFDTAQVVQLPRKPLLRGLSAIVAGLRRVEEEKLDDDLEALREIESNDLSRPSKQQPLAEQMAEVGILTQDGQPATSLLGGLDDEGMYDGQIEDKLTLNESSGRVFKKKLPKRTTRLVNMKPVRVRRPGGISQDTRDKSSTMGTVPACETYHEVRDYTTCSGASEANISGSEAVHVQSETATKSPGRTIKRTLAKVNTVAHANFRRLKLKNRGANGGPGHGSRFRRRK